GAAARIASAIGWTCTQRNEMRAAPPRCSDFARDGRRPGGEAHLTRIPRALLSHAAQGSRGLPYRDGRASLRARFRPRLQYRRGVHRTLAQEASPRSHKDCPWARLPPFGRGRGGLTLSPSGFSPRPRPGPLSSSPPPPFSSPPSTATPSSETST